MYLSLDELDDHRLPGETDADLLMRSIHFAQSALDEDGAARLLAHELLKRAGLDEDDPTGLELARALVARARFFTEYAGLEPIGAE